jgi:Na+/proline symporter
MIEQWILIAASVFFIIVGFIGPRAAHHQPVLGKLSAFRIAAGLAMSFIGGAAMIAMSGIGYSNGYYGFIDPMAVLLGGLLVAAIIPRIKLPASTQGISDYFAGQAPRLRVVYSVAMLFVYILFAAAQVVALRKLAEPYLGPSAASAFAVVSFVCILLYVYRGGIFSITRTDIVQLVVVVVLFILPALYGLYTLSQESLAVQPRPQEPLDLRTCLYLSLTFLFVPLSQDAWVRIRLAKNSKTASFGVAIGVLIYAIAVALAVQVGNAFAESGVAVADAETVLPEFFRTHLGFAGIIPSIVVLAAIMSSLDTFIYNISSTVLEDFRPPEAVASKRKWNIAVHAAILLLCPAIALFTPMILSLILTALMIYVSVLGPGLLARRFGVRADDLYLPAWLTLGSVLALSLFKIKVPGEPYSFFIAHFVLIGIYLLLLKTVSRSNHNTNEK